MCDLVFVFWVRRSSLEFGISFSFDCELFHILLSSTQAYPTRSKRDTICESRLREAGNFCLLQTTSSMLQRLRTPLSTSSRTLQPLSSLPLLSLRSYVSSRSISTSSSRTTSTTPISNTRQFSRPHAGTSNTRRSPTAIDRDLPVIKVSFSCFPLSLFPFTDPACSVGSLVHPSIYHSSSSLLFVGEVSWRMRQTQNERILRLLGVCCSN